MTREKDPPVDPKVFLQIPADLDPTAPAVQEDWHLLGEVSLETFFPALIVCACAYKCMSVPVCVERDWRGASVPAENLFLELRGNWASLPLARAPNHR